MSSSELWGLRILIVEDDPIIALDVAETLVDAGAIVVGPAHTVTQASSSWTAAASMRRSWTTASKERCHHRSPTGWGEFRCLTFFTPVRAWNLRRPTPTSPSSISRRNETFWSL